jgi:CBS domain-containing protein
MEDVLVANLMSTDLLTVSRDTLVEDAAAILLEEGVSSLLVTDETGHLEGILTTTDFVDIVAKSDPAAETTVERYMTTDVVTASAQDTVQQAADMMIEAGFHHVPVVDPAEGVIGILSTTDITAYLSTVQTPSPAEHQRTGDSRLSLCRQCSWSGNCKGSLCIVAL